jgi:hypothetical protein
MRRAALDAGYSAAMAKNAGQKIMPGAINEFKEALAKTVPQSKLIQRIAEGINAKKTIFAQFQGSFTDSRQLVDYSERRRYVELVCKLFGCFNESEISKEDEAPVEYNLTVRFTDPDTKEVLPAALDEHGRLTLPWSDEEPATGPVTPSEE